MSMRNYAVYEKGLVLGYKDFEILGKSYKGGNEDIDNDKDMLELIEDMKNGDSDFYSVQEFLESIGFYCVGNLESGIFRKFFGNVNEKGLLYNGNTEYLDEEDEFMVLALDKDTLFQKYENLEEIYNEIDTFLKRNGFKVSREFLQNNVGEISGVSFG